MAQSNINKNAGPCPEEFTIHICTQRKTTSGEERTHKTRVTGDKLHKYSSGYTCLVFIRGVNYLSVWYFSAACAINALLMELLPYLGSPEQLRDAVFVQEELHNKIALLVQLLPRDVVLRQVGRPVLLVCLTSDGDFETLELEDWVGWLLLLYWASRESILDGANRFYRG